MRKFIAIIIISLLFYPTFGQQTIFDITTNAKVATGELEAIYDIDVFRYYNIKEYDTELKQVMFKKTEEYKSKLAELKEIKVEMLKSTYYFIKYFAYGNNYDIKRKGFEFELGSNMGMGTISARTPKSINDILFKALPTKQVNEPLFGSGIYTEKLFFPVDEATGLEIENDKENIAIYFFFTLKGRKKTIFKFFIQNSPKKK